MKRTLKLILLVLLVTFVSSCVDDGYAWQSIYNELTTGMIAEGDSFETITQDLFFALESSAEPLATIFWSSSNPAIISNEGVVNRPFDTIERVVITIRIEMPDAFRVYSVTLFVMPTKPLIVTFISLGKATEVEVTLFSTVEPPEVEEQLAFQLVGWRLETADELFDFSTVIETDFTLVAVWVDKTYTVEFNSNGGSYVESIENIIHSTTLELIETPVKEGYLFIGWIFIDLFENEQLLVEGMTIINQNIEAYALWIKVEEETKE
jgi:hypothetical protein